MLKDEIGDTGSVQRIYRRHQLPELTGYSAVYIHELIEAEKFPRPVPLGGGRAVGWLEQDLLKWQRQRIAERDEQASAAAPVVG
jgi:predicted DNA-binding transcriptional regulator AlpA